MNIFREFEKNNDKYIATNNFYISSDDECGNIEYNLFNINSLNKIVNDKIIVYSDNLYINVRNNEYINLITLSNISFSLNDIDINKNYIINKFMESDVEIDDNIIEDIYYNNEFAKRMNINLPDKYMNQSNIEKKYLFKINMVELNQSFYQENNKLVLSL